MLIDIETFFLNSWSDAYASYLMHDEHYEPASCKRPCDDTQDAKGLNSEQGCPTAIEETAVQSEETDCKSSDYATDSVY